MPHDHDHVLADVAKGDASHVERAIVAAREAHPAWSSTPWHERVAVFLRAAELLAGPWRSTLTAATMLEPVEDRAPGRDRRGVRDDRLPPLQLRVPRAHLRGAADLLARRLEPARVPAARGVRLRDQPVQLHGDRREPDDVAGADGQHRRLEAGLDAGALGLVHAAAPRGGGPSARSDQPRVRARAPSSARRRCEPRARGRPLHGLDRRVPLDLEDDRRRHRPLPQLPADRRRDRRQGLHPRPPVRRRGGGRDGDRPRLVRVPGAEVLGLVAPLHPVEPVGRRSRAARAGRPRRSRWATP